ncbi:MAG: hypothetical protein ACFB02_22405 [Mastigocoleus sp.]
MSEHRLGEIVIERPRNGWRISLKKCSGYKKNLEKITQEATEDGLLNTYIIKPRNKTKCFSDHIRPLYKWLCSKIGQPWNDVYSELCKNLNIKGLSGQHILSHIWNFVELHVVLIDGIPYRKSERDRPLPSYGRYEQLYVHPDTGILCLVREVQRKVTRKYDDVLIINSYHQYRKIKGIWYLITFQKFPKSIYDNIYHAKDVLFRANINYKIAQKTYGRKIFAVSKKQCNKKEIKFIIKKLENLQ